MFSCSKLRVGGALLACPVTDKGVREVQVLLPGSGEVNRPPGGAVVFSDRCVSSDKACVCCQVWYEVSSAKAHKGGGMLRLPVNLLTVSVPKFRTDPSISPSSTADCNVLVFPGSCVPTWRLGGLQVNRKWLLLRRIPAAPPHHHCGPGLSGGCHRKFTPVSVTGNKKEVGLDRRKYRDRNMLLYVT